VLTNLPVNDIASTPLGRHDYPTGAEAQSIVLDVGGRQVGIVNTHLQAPAGQAPEVAEIARRLALGALPGDIEGPASTGRTVPTGAGGAIPSGDAPASEGDRRPVIVAGDLNITRSDPEMRVLEAAGLSDALLAFGDPPTSPADRPIRRIDHVLISPGLVAVAGEAPRVPFSDHLPVVVRLRLT
jgi:endonuclease/exonuclease/phosphatase family metal-dependent hydrolase